MHYLGLALYAEGPTDYYFLRPLLLRLCEEICLNEANQSVEFGEEVISLNEPARMKDAPREERIIEAAREARGAWRIVFIHTDGAGSAERARAKLRQRQAGPRARSPPSTGSLRNFPMMVSPSRWSRYAKRSHGRLQMAMRFAGYSVPPYPTRCWSYRATPQMWKQHVIRRGPCTSPF